MRRLPDQRAVLALAAAELRLQEEQERANLRLFRLRLQATVLAVSPFARDLAALHGYGLDEVAEMLRPRPYGGIKAGRANRLHIHVDGGRRRASRAPLRPMDLRLSRRISREGAIVHADGDVARMGFVAEDGAFAAAGWLGDHWFTTDRGFVDILLTPALPETMAFALSGMGIGSLIAHPALVGRDYPIFRVSQLEYGLASVVSIRTGLVDHEMPWRDLLATEMER